MWNKADPCRIIVFLNVVLHWGVRVSNCLWSRKRLSQCLVRRLFCREKSYQIEGLSLGEQTARGHFDSLPCSSDSHKKYKFSDAEKCEPISCHATALPDTLVPHFLKQLTCPLLSAKCYSTEVWLYSCLHSRWKERCLLPLPPINSPLCCKVPAVPEVKVARRHPSTEAVKCTSFPLHHCLPGRPHCVSVSDLELFVLLCAPSPGWLSALL